MGGATILCPGSPCLFIRTFTFAHDSFVFFCPFLPNFVLMLHLKMLYPTHIHWKIVVIENCHQKQHESICMTSNTVVNQSVFHVFIVFIVSTPMRIVYIITNSYWDDWWCCHICVACAVDNEMIQSLVADINIAHLIPLKIGKTRSFIFPATKSDNIQSPEQNLKVSTVHEK